MELSKFKKLKIGDVVRVRQDLSFSHGDGGVCVNETMIKLAGQYLTVCELFPSGLVPTLRTKENSWFWTPSMLENIILDKFEKNVTDPTICE